MKIKRFFAKDMRTAIRMVREELGPDAVILSNRKVDGGVEIVSAIDYDEALVDQALPASARRRSEEGAQASPASAAKVAPAATPTASSPAARNAASDSRDHASPTDTPPAPRADTARPGIYWAQDPALVSMREEIREMRGLLEHQLAHLAWGEMCRNRPHEAELLGRLTQLGLQPALAQSLATEVGEVDSIEQAWSKALGLLARRLPVTDDDILSHGGVVAVVGPTGVGKTTSIAKLAARYALRYGQRQVALVSTDSYRIGAHEQLLTYGRILGVPVHMAADAAELEQVLTDLMDRQLVLIDTAGMSQRDLRLSEQFSTLKALGSPVKIYLAMSATTQPTVLDEAVRAFSAVPLDGCILTKLDEAASLGGALSVISEQHLPLAYVSDGQRVPEDMHPARPHNLVNRAADLMRESGQTPGEITLAEQFGGMAANAHV